MLTDGGVSGEISYLESLLALFKSLMARCTSNLSITARCKLDLVGRDFLLPCGREAFAGSSYATEVEGSPSKGEPIVESDSPVLVVELVDVRCEGTINGVGRGGGGHFRRKGKSR